MVKSVPALALSAVLVVAACGGSDDGDGEGEGATSGEPGLTAEQIGDDSMVVIGSYDIDGDTLQDGVDGPPSADTQATFDLFANLIPSEYRQVVVSLVAIDQEQSDGVDGALQDVIGADGEPSGERYLALDVTGSSEELERTIVHEMGHAIFVEPGGGIAEVAQDFNANWAPGAEYDPELFVTEYAASSPEDAGEDIAESWAMYVFVGTEFAGDADGDGELDVVPDGTTAAEKVAFFDGYPDLVQLREDILASL